jgi:hypothetical protein
MSPVGLPSPQAPESTPLAVSYATARVPVSPGNEYLVHRHGFLCATPQVTLGVGKRRQGQFRGGHRFVQIELSLTPFFYQVQGKVLVVTVIAMGKREKGLIHRAAKKRL